MGLLVTWRGVDGDVAYKETVYATVEVLAPVLTLPEENIIAEVPQEEADIAALEPGDVSLGAYVRASAVHGGTLTLAIPLNYTIGEQVYASNADGQGGIKPYESGLAAGDCGQSGLSPEALCGVHRHRRSAGTRISA